MLQNSDGNSFGNSLVILPQHFYTRDTVTVARDLLDKYLVYTAPDGEKIGRIIETEAYSGITDKGSHSHRGLTPRTRPLFGPAGHAYIYLVYGMYHCFNVVTDTPESGGAVLVRAVTPVIGLTGKTNGPGLLCKAYGITKAHNEHPLTQPSLTIQENPTEPPPSYTVGPRVGIDYAASDRELPYRFRIAE